MPYKAPSPSNAWTCTLNQSAVSADQSQPFQLTFGDELVFNLDKIASGFIKKLYGNKTLSSVDAFKEKDGEFYFIEFKNQPQKILIQIVCGQKLSPVWWFYNSHYILN